MFELVFGLMFGLVFGLGVLGLEVHNETGTQCMPGRSYPSLRFRMYGSGVGLDLVNERGTQWALYKRHWYL